MTWKSLRFKISLALFLVATLAIAFVTLSSFFSMGELIRNRSSYDLSTNMEIARTIVSDETSDVEFYSDYFSQHPVIREKFVEHAESDTLSLIPAPDLVFLFDRPRKKTVPLTTIMQSHNDIQLMALFDQNGSLIESAGLADRRSERLHNWLVEYQNAMANTYVGSYSHIVELPIDDFSPELQETLNSKKAGLVLIKFNPITRSPESTVGREEPVGWILVGKVLNTEKPGFLMQIRQAMGTTRDARLFTPTQLIAATDINSEQFEAGLQTVGNNIAAYISSLNKLNYRVMPLILDRPLNQDPTTVYVGVRDRQGMLRKAEQTMMLQLLIFAIVGIVVTGGASFILTGSVFRPIRDLITAMRTVEDGDFSVVSKVNTRDEFGRLAQNFNEFTAQIRESMDKESRYVQELASINEFGQGITQELDLDKLLNRVVETTLKMMAVRRCSLWLMTGDGKALQNRITRGVAIFDSIEKPTVKVGEGIVGTVAETGKPLMINDLKTSEDFSDLDNPEYYGVRSILSVPLIALDKKIGVLNVSKEVADGFDINNRNLLSTLAGQAGIAIHNANLYGQIAEKKRIEEELNIYRRIQMRLIPNRVPTVKGLMIHSSMIPAKEVGGDYYDFLLPKSSEDDSLGIVIGDVSGKGVSAGLIMMRTRTILHALAASKLSPRDALVQLNGFLASTVEVGKFMTLLYLLWDPDNRKMSYAAAGHEHILVYKASEDKCQSIKSGGIAVGMVDDIGSLTKQKELSVETGDAIVLYTDGVTEAENTSGERYELPRLISAVEKHGMKPAKELHKIIMDDIYQFIGGAEQWDDITLLVMKVGEVSPDQQESDQGEFFIDQELDMQFSTLTIE